MSEIESSEDQRCISYLADEAAELILKLCKARAGLAQEVQNGIVAGDELRRLQHAASQDRGDRREAVSVIRAAFQRLTSYAGTGLTEDETADSVWIDLGRFLMRIKPYPDKDRPVCPICKCRFFFFSPCSAAHIDQERYLLIMEGDIYAKKG